MREDINLSYLSTQQVKAAFAPFLSRQLKEYHESLDFSVLPPQPKQEVKHVVVI